jgi:hypothetical protein
MKTIQKLLAIFIITFCLAGTCTDDDESDDDDDGNCSVEQLQEKSDVLISKTNAFTANQTTANCNAYRVAWFDVYDQLKDCGESTAELESTKTIVEELPCGTFGN